MKDLTSGNIYKNFILFAIPMVFAGLLSQMYATIDTVIAGKYLGEVGLAAIGATAPLISFVSSAFWGLSSGFSIYIANLFGAKEYRLIKNTVFTGVTVFCSVIFTISLFLVIFQEPLFEFLNVDKSIVKEASAYFTVYVLGLFLIMMNTTGLLMINSFGIGTFPFVMSVLSAVLNVSGNIFSIIVLHWGVFGVALSSVVAAGIVDVCYILKFRSCYKEMGISGHKARFSISSFLSSASYALPNMIQQMIMYGAGFMVSPLVNSIGKSATASYTVCQRVFDINAAVYQNSSKTLANYIAQANGGKKEHLFSKGVKVGFIQGFIFTFPFILICALFPEHITSLFFKDKTDTVALVYAVQFLTYFIPLISINVVANLFHAFFRGLGSKSPLMVSTAFGTVARIGVSYVLISKMGMTGMFIGWSASWGADALVGLIYYVLFILKSKKEKGKLV
ncbi:MAG: hypothetical protein IJ323_03845 [Clostridia bacterium]|nr:hypothetical protein [Clostridia bacterium]